MVQIGHKCHSESPELGVLTFPDRDFVPLINSHLPHGTGCRLDSGCFERLAKRLANAIEAGADLVIINRFGHSEAEGAGLTDLIAQAIEADIPVLIAVSERRFPTWIRFCGGMSVRLGCRRDEIDRWWRSVWRSSTQPAPIVHTTFCELAK